MKRIQTNKRILKESIKRLMNVHTDWTGTRVETVNEMESVDEFVDRLWDYLEEESDRMD